MPCQHVEMEALLVAPLFPGVQTQNMLSTREIWDSLYGVNVVKDVRPSFHTCALMIKLVDPTKPDCYGIKVFWVPNAEINLPLLGISYLGRPLGPSRHTNVDRNMAVRLDTPFFKRG